MLRKRGSGYGGELPLGGAPDKKYEDGSGKSIKMESPLAKAIRSADGFIKGTYIWLFISLFFIWGGWSWMRRNTASMVLDCNAGGCTLTIQTPYKFLPRNSSTGIPTKTKKRSKRKTKIDLQRDQLVRADNIKWNPSSQEIVENYGMHSPTYKNDDEDEGDGKRSNKPWNQQNKKKDKKYKKKPSSIYRNNGPDRDGNYESYVIVNHGCIDLDCW